MPVECVCKSCGELFQARRSVVAKGRRKFCSRQCHDMSQRKRVDRVCKSCGVAFQVRLSTAKRTAAIFCSHKCQGAFATSSRQYQRRVHVRCKRCGRDIERPSSGIRSGNVYCSKACRRHREVRQCKRCGKDIDRAVANLKGRKSVFCDRQCQEYHVLRECRVCGRDFKVQMHKLQFKGDRGVYCSNQCRKASPTEILKLHSLQRSIQDRRRFYTQSMLRRFIEWSDKGCAFPLCKELKGRSKWNLCSLHAKRLNNKLYRRRASMRSAYKENL